MSQSVPSGPLDSLRTAHEALTRQRILAAAAALLAEEHPAALAMSGVAQRAGVARATVYRHFPSLEALLDAVSTLGDEQTRAWLGDRALRLEELPEFARRMWSEMARQRDLFYAQHVTPAGRAVRARRAVRRRAETNGILRAAGVRTDLPAGERLAALGMLLLSSAAFLELCDVYGISVQDASDYVSWACLVLARESLRLQGEDAAVGPAGAADTRPDG